MANTHQDGDAANDDWSGWAPVHGRAERLVAGRDDRHADFVIETLTATGIPMRRVLDVGCGRGRLTRRLAEAFPDAIITAVDANPDHLVQARTYCDSFAHRITFAQHDPVADAPFPFPANGYDVALANGALLRLPEPVVQRILTRLAGAARYVVGEGPSEGGTGATTTGLGVRDLARLYVAIGKASAAFAEPPDGDGARRALIIAASPAALRALRLELPTRDRRSALPAPLVDARARGRIALVNHAFPVVSETFLVRHFLRLLDAGWDAHVVVPRSNAALWSYFPELRAHREAPARIHVAPDVEAELQSLAPALVHFQFGTLAIGRLRALRRSGAKSIVSLRGFDIAFTALETSDYYDEVWDAADLVHCVSEDLWHRALERGCPPDKPHAVITDAIDVAAFDPGGRTAAGVVGFPSRPLRTLSVGRLTWKKGHEYALQAIRQLVDRGVACQHRIVGDGEHRPAVIHAIHDLGLHDVVEAIGSCDAAGVREQLRWADVFVQPSVSEGFGVAVIEAQAMKLPVVCTDAEGLAENIADGETGFLVPRRDPAAIAERLLLLAGDPSLRQRMGEAGRARVERLFRADAQMAAFQRLYEETMDVLCQAAAFYRGLVREGPPPAGPDYLRLFHLERAFADRSLK